MNRPLSIDPLSALVSSQVAVNGAHFLALPVLVVFWAAKPGIGTEIAGLALGAFLAVARLGPLVTGPLADRMGAWSAIRLGLVLRSVGLASVTLAEGPLTAFMSAALLGSGIAFHEPGIYGALGSASSVDRDRLLLKHVQALNLGCVVGPAIAILVGLSPSWAFLFAATATGFAAIWSFLVAGPEIQELKAKDRNSLLVCDRRFVAFAVALIPFWALFAQLFAALPVMVTKAGGAECWAQSVILVNGLTGFLAVPLMLPLLRRSGPRPMIALGSALAACSIGSLAVPLGLAALIMLIVVLSIAETAVTTAADIMTANHANGRDVGSHFGVLTVGAGVGTSLGAPLGVIAADGNLFGLLVLGSVGLASCLAAWALPDGNTTVSPRCDHKSQPHKEWAEAQNSYHTISNADLAQEGKEALVLAHCDIDPNVIAPQGTGTENISWCKDDIIGQGSPGQFGGIESAR